MAVRALPQGHPAEEAMTERIFVTEAIWVELLQDHAVVSWPGGHKPISYEAPVADLLNLLRLAVNDVLAERPTHAEVKADQERQFDKGFRAGWEERSQHLSAPAS